MNLSANASDWVSSSGNGDPVPAPAATDDLPRAVQAAAGQLAVVKVAARGQLEVRAHLKSLVDSATRSLVWSRHGLGATQWGGIRSISAETSRNLEVRVLLGLAPADISAAIRSWQRSSWQGTQVRVLPPGAGPVEFLVVDDERACLSSLDDDGEPVLREIGDPAIARLLASAFTLAWVAAAKLDETEQLAGLLEVPVTRAILRMLVDGAKDEAIARMLGISLRTCRRHAAMIMTALASTSRFQAGHNLGRASALADLLDRESPAAAPLGQPRPGADLAASCPPRSVEVGDAAYADSSKLGMLPLAAGRGPGEPVALPATVLPSTRIGCGEAPEVSTMSIDFAACDVTELPRGFGDGTLPDRSHVEGVTSLTSLPGEQIAPMLRIEVLGAMRVWLADEEIHLRQAQQRAILALLVLSEHAPVTPERLIQALWIGEPPASARNVVHTQVKRLRQAFEPDRMSRSRSTVLPSAGDGYVLDRGSASVDLWQFRSLVRRAVRARSCHDDAAVFAHLGEAISLWRDTPFADVAPVRDSAPARTLVEQYACVVGWYAEAGIRTGHAGEVLGLVEQAAHARPLDEAAQALLMRAYHATARRSDGFTVYQRTQQALAEELGVDPGRELRATYEALLRDKPASTPAPVDQADPSKMMLRMLLALGVDPASIPDSVGRRAAMLRGRLDVIADVQPSYSRAP